MYLYVICIYMSLNQKLKEIIYLYFPFPSEGFKAPVGFVSSLDFRDIFMGRDFPVFLLSISHTEVEPLVLVCAFFSPSPARPRIVRSKTRNTREVLFWSLECDRV